MDIRDLNHDHPEAKGLGGRLLTTMARPDRHVDVDRPGDRSLIECQVSDQQGS